MVQSDLRIKPDEILPEPRRTENEPVFNSPWEARIFAMTINLYDKKFFDWEDFRQRLIAEIAVADSLPENERPTYYESWLAALEKLLIKDGILTKEQIDERTKELKEGIRKSC